MNKQGQLGTGEIVVLFMGIIVCIAFLPAIFNTQNIMTDKQLVINESIDITPAVVGAGGTDINVSYEFNVTQAPTGWKITGCPLTSVTYGNSSDDYTLTTDYLINLTSGLLTLLNTTTVNNLGSNNDTLIDYTYCADGYNTDGGARGIAGIIGLFSVLALLGFIFFYLRFKYD